MSRPEQFPDVAAGRRVVTIVSDQQLNDPVWLADAKRFAYNLQIPRGRARDFLATGLERSNAILLTPDGEFAEIDLELIEQPELKDDDADPFVWWWKDWAQPVPIGCKPRVRPESRERIRLIATILRLIFKETILWGRPDNLDVKLLKSRP